MSIEAAVLFKSQHVAASLWIWGTGRFGDNIAFARTDVSFLMARVFRFNVQRVKDLPGIAVFMFFCGTW